MKELLIFTSILAISTGYLTKGPPEGHVVSFSAIDCESPARFRATSFSKVCEQKPVTEPKLVEAALLQHVYEHKIKAIRCERRITTITFQCAVWSHTKVVKALDVQLLEPFSSRQCKNTIDSKLYITESGRAIPIEYNKEIQYQETVTGTMNLTPNDVQCQGYSQIIDGRKHENIVSLATYTVLLREVELEYDTRKHVVTDLEAHTLISSACIDKKMCADGERAYVMTQRDFCPYVILQAGDMEVVEITTTTSQTIDAIVNRKHKALFRIEKEISALDPCIDFGKGLATNHADVIILYPDDMEALKARVPVASGDEVDLELEITTSEAFLELRFIESIQKYLANSLGSLCKLGIHSLPQLLPSPLHKDRFIHISGEILSELSCTKVTVTAMLGDQPVNWCSRDILPVRYNKKQVFLSANSRMITFEVPNVLKNCSIMEMPFFIADSGLIVTADPKIRQAHVELDTEGLNLLRLWEENTTLTEDDWGESLVYSKDAMLNFNHVLHYGLTQSKVVSSLTKAYCSSGNCGSYKPSSSSGFDVNNLIEHASFDLSLASRVYNTLLNMGSITSLFVGAYALAQIFWFFMKKFAPGLVITPPEWLSNWTRKQNNVVHRLESQELRPILRTTVQEQIYPDLPSETRDKEGNVNLDVYKYLDDK
jgi:hypothetical protein